LPVQIGRRDDILVDEDEPPRPGPQESLCTPAPHAADADKDDARRREIPARRFADEGVRSNMAR
jgi:hypothetical protein